MVQKDKMLSVQVRIFGERKHPPIEVEIPADANIASLHASVLAGLRSVPPNTSLRFIAKGQVLEPTQLVSSALIQSLQASNSSPDPPLVVHAQIVDSKALGRVAPPDVCNVIQVSAQTYPHTFKLGTLEGTFTSSSTVSELREWIQNRAMPRHVEVRFFNGTTELTKDAQRIVDVVSLKSSTDHKYAVHAVLLDLVSHSDYRYSSSGASTAYACSSSVGSSSSSSRQISLSRHNTFGTVVGKLVALGSTSQYTWGEAGRSACTSIALVGALTLLRRREVHGEKLGLAPDPTVEANEKLVNIIVSDGVQLATERLNSENAAAEHVSTDELLDSLPPGHRLRRFLNNEQDSFAAGLLKASRADTVTDFVKTFNKSPGMACVFTKPPETVLVLVGVGSEPSYLFDSHPRPPCWTQAHLLRFETIKDLSRGLCTRFLSHDISGLSEYD